MSSRGTNSGIKFRCHPLNVNRAARKMHDAPVRSPRANTGLKIQPRKTRLGNNIEFTPSVSSPRQLLLKRRAVAFICRDP